jgi:hypothetical protein
LGLGGEARIERRRCIDDGGEEFGLHELIDALETVALRALTVARAALVRQQHFQIVSKLVHGR